MLEYMPGDRARRILPDYLDAIGPTARTLGKTPLEEHLHVGDQNGISIIGKVLHRPLILCATDQPHIIDASCRLGSGP